MNRRIFSKTVAATVVADTATVVIPSVLARGEISNKSVTWNTAYSHIPKGEFYWGYCNKQHAGGISLITVVAVEEIKAGQAVIWNPDGTVRGA